MDIWQAFLHFLCILTGREDCSRDEYHCSNHNKGTYETAANVSASTPAGDVLGRLFVSESGVRAHVYRGVPYATQKRFEKPKLVTKFEQEPLDATATAPICHQFAYSAPLMHLPYVQSEDCLLLNILAPAERGEKRPVIVWMHGGAFRIGSGNDYSLGGMIDNFVARGILFVTVQYRLGPLGFLYHYKGESLPLNLGLYDQNAAIGWVVDNIESFGGDPSRVTLMGESAGAVSVDYQHNYNPAPRVRGSIVMSGWMLSDFYAYQEEAVRALAEGVGCGKAGDLLPCLRRAHVDGMAKALSEMPALGNGTLFDPVVFGPAPDGDIVPHNATDAVLNTKRGAVMTGSTSDEDIVFAIMHALAHPTDIDFEWMKRAMREKIDATEAIEDKEEAYERSMKYYFEDKGRDPGNPHDIIRTMGDLYNDVEMYAPSAREARLLSSNAANKVWLYSFEYARPEMYTDYGLQLVGPYHTADLVYAFSNVFWPAVMNTSYVFDRSDCAVSEAFTGAMADFAAGGEPRGAHWGTWPRVADTGADGGSHMRIDYEATVENGYRADAERMWNGRG